MPTPHPRPWHRNSVFGEGRRRLLDRNQRARFRFLLATHARANRITPKGEKVGLALLKRHGVDGRCDPSHATLAADAGCEERTVRRANDQLYDLKLLTWQQRIVRNGWRVEQTSNAYELLPSEAVHSPSVRPPSCGGHSVRQTCSLDKSRELPFLPDPSDTNIAIAQAALAERRRAIEAKLLGSYRLPGW